MRVIRATTMTAASSVMYRQHCRWDHSTSTVPRQQQRPFRRTKRTNYADREHVLFPDMYTSFEGGTTVEENCDATNTLSSLFPSTAIPTEAVSTQTTSIYTKRVPLSHADRLELQKSALVLNALATPVLGRLLYYGLTAMAYIRYGVGHVSFYTRQSVAPPLSSSSSASTETSSLSSTCSVSSASIQHLIEMGAYEQAAAAFTSEKGDISSSHCRVNAPHFRGILHGKSLECLYIGLSPIHSRGLITSRDIPRGTRIVTEPQRSYMDAANFVPLLADTHLRLPDTWHYTHPSGVLLELVTQPLPHHIMNHSCDPNVCSGLSRQFWPAAIASNNAELLNRIQSFPHFDDPNSFFTTRDVPAGGELTLSYAHRVAPLFSGENPLQKFFVVCRCGSPNCRHFLYRPTDDVMRHVSQLSRSWNGVTKRRKGIHDETDEISQLLQLGFDDETVFLSLLPTRAQLMAYMRTHLASSRRTVSKGQLLACYRHVFKLLNEAAPKEQNPCEDVSCRETK
ncbi:hypothetical protein MOQ_005723 [Trypanosoma cruzi marinkellei]|uniref:SET domain-containing protein n=1 Tax=Trypanosoma cruzi marinkellei TaxID=85056 RepID=K2N733_TRYCR|nr:hypothetical protein MOQ_005723 [Trypanosoma cruzi marinkellei]